jgi:hypothetical protein
MLAATSLAIFVVPVLFVAIEKLVNKGKMRKDEKESRLA